MFDRFSFLIQCWNTFYKSGSLEVFCFKTLEKGTYVSRNSLALTRLSKWHNGCLKAWHKSNIKEPKMIPIMGWNAIFWHGAVHENWRPTKKNIEKIFEKQLFSSWGSIKRNPPIPGCFCFSMSKVLYNISTFHLVDRRRSKACQEVLAS